MTPHQLPPTPAADRVLAAIALFDGWRYGTASVPRHLPGVPEAVRVGLGTTDCCTFTAWCLLAAYPALRECPGAWADLCIWDADRRWSPIEYLVEAGVGVESRIERPGAYLTQSWHRDGSGHARLVFAGRDGLRVWDASRRRGGVTGYLLSPDAVQTWGETRAALLV